GDAPAVVLGDPVLDGTERAAQRLSDVASGPPLFGEDDGLDASPVPFLGDGLSQSLEVFPSVVIGDKHGGGPRGVWRRPQLARSVEPTTVGAGSFRVSYNTESRRRMTLRRVRSADR